MIYLLIHVLISILCFFIGAKRNPATERFGNAMIALFFPIGGPIIVILSNLLQDQKVSALSEDDFQNPIILFTDKIDINSEINIISLEDLFSMGDVAVKRKQVIDTLKTDLSGLMDKFQLALRDEDVETSHYAASAISEIRRSMDLKLQQMQHIYEQNSSNLEIVDQYIYVLKEYINSNVNSDINVSRIARTYENVLKNRLELDPNTSAQICNDLIELLLKSKKFDEAQEYIDLHMKRYNNEDSYIYKMELHYDLHDRKAFKDTYNVLLNSSVRLTNRGLEIVRFWMDGMKNEAVGFKG